MRRDLLLLASLAAAVAAAGSYACSSEPPPVALPDAGPADTGWDSPVAYGETCVVSPKPAPFPSGACSSPKPAQPDSFDEALSKIGYDRCSVAIDVKNMPAAVMDIYDKRQLADFKPLLNYPLRMPAYGAETAKWLDDAVTSKRPVSSAIAAMAARRGAPVTDCPPDAWFAVQTTDTAPLATALADVAAALGADFDADAARAAVAPVPLELQRALAPVARAMGGAYQAALDARQPALASLATFKLAPTWVAGLTAMKWNQALLDAVDGVNVAEMTAAATQLATAIEAADLARFRDVDIPPVDLDTPFGHVSLRGAGGSRILPGDIAEGAALLLDTGGADDYRVPVAAATPDRPVAVAIDLGGDDRWGYVEKPAPDDSVGHRLPSDGTGRAGGRTNSRVGRQASALLGVALLYDLGAGKDTYRSLFFSQGAAVFGVGVLYDDGGDDDYGAEALSQGAGAWGVGMLLDGGGNDKYVGYTAMQGFGFTQGVGALEDLSGDDSYLTDPGHPQVNGDPIYPSAQLPTNSNIALSQGCGEGHRPDAPDPGFQFAGGFGVLRDGAGKDSYVTSVFGQGCAFGMGLGMLLEGGGDDKYEGLWYVQGANAHTSASYFFEGGGNDTYNPTFPIAATSIGVGHDYSAAIHYDVGGDDVYRAPGLSLGSGNANGLGVMLVVGGTDSFTAPGNPTLGAANSTEIFGVSSRRVIPTVGVFVKAGGAGTYMVGGLDGGSFPGQSWSYTPNNNPDGGLPNYEKSVGIDRPGGSGGLP